MTDIESPGPNARFYWEMYGGFPIDNPHMNAHVVGLDATILIGGHRAKAGGYHGCLAHLKLRWAQDKCPLQMLHAAPAGACPSSSCRHRAELGSDRQYQAVLGST